MVSLGRSATTSVARRTLGEYDKLIAVPARQCTVSFSDFEGIRHSVQVPAESLYEAAVLALRAFREHDCSPGPAAKLEVEVAGPAVTHTLTVKKVREWLDGACRSPNEKVAKERLKGLLA